MIRSALLFAVLLLASPLALAQERPDSPTPKTEPNHSDCFRDCLVKPHLETHFNRKVFVAEVSLLAASKTADAITTRQNLDRGGWENNPAFGRHPSPAKQSLINMGIFGAQAGLFYLTEHNRHAWIRWTGRAFIGHAILEHSLLAACNAGINVNSPAIQSCRPYAPF